MDERTRRVLRALDSGEVLRESFIAEVRRYDALFSDRVFPALSDPDTKALRAAQEHWDSRMAEPVGEDDVDPGAIADQARDVGLALYFTEVSMHQTVLNLFSAGLFHLFEQQVATLYRDWTDERAPWPALGLCRAWLRRELGIDVTTAPSWGRLHELELVANVVKHAEGRSSEELRAVNEEYFREPLIREEAYRALPTQSGLPVGAPLMGEDIYVTKDDYDRFVQAVVALWEWLAAELDTRLRAAD